MKKKKLTALAHIKVTRTLKLYLILKESVYSHWLYVLSINAFT